jgi:hypothetical protein
MSTPSAAYRAATKEHLYGFDSQRDAYESGWEAGYQAAFVAATESCAEKMFNVWRTDQTGDTWRQLRPSERAAWCRVATMMAA